MPEWKNYEELRPDQLEAQLIEKTIEAAETRNPLY